MVCMEEDFCKWVVMLCVLYPIIGFVLSDQTRKLKDGAIVTCYQAPVWENTSSVSKMHSQDPHGNKIVKTVILVLS